MLQVGEPFWSTTNTKLALCLATLGIPFHKSQVLKKWTTKRGEQAEWFFEQVGEWRNLDGKTAIIKSTDCDAAWHGLEHKLPKECLKELLIIKQSLENRDNMLAAMKSRDMSVSYVAELLEQNRKVIVELYKSKPLYGVETYKGKRLILNQEAPNKEKEVWRKRLTK